MTANTRNGVRPTGRSPPFLAIGLVVALVILGFNYWSLSARNGEQANEIAVLESEMRLMNAKKISAEKRSEAIADKVKDFETELAQQKAVVADKIAQLANIGNELDRVKSEKQGCEVEFQKCEHEKVPFCLKEKDELRMELSSVKEALDREKNVPKAQETQCGESSCATYVEAGRHKLLSQIAKELGMTPMYTLYKSGVDVGDYKQQMIQLAGQRGESIQQGQAGAQPPAQGIQPLVNIGQGLAQLNQNQQSGNQQPNPAENQQAGVQQPFGAQPPVGAQPPQSQNNPDARVVEQELPQLPNPNDAQANANANAQIGDKDANDQINPDALDRIQPNVDTKLDRLSIDNDKLQQASNHTQLSTEDKGRGVTAAPMVNSNSTVINTTKSENGTVGATNTSMPVKEMETTKVNTTTTKAQENSLDARLQVDGNADDAADGDGDMDEDEDDDVALADNDRDQGFHNRDDALRVQPFGDQDKDNNLGDDYDYKDDDLDDDDYKNEDGNMDNVALADKGTDEDLHTMNNDDTYPVQNPVDKKIEDGNEDNVALADNGTDDDLHNINNDDTYPVEDLVGKKRDLNDDMEDRDFADMKDRLEKNAQQ